MVSIGVNDAQLFEPKLKEVAARGVIVRLNVERIYKEWFRRARTLKLRFA